MSEFITKHSASGQKDVSLTGAVRDTQEGKVRYDLIGRHMLKRLSLLLARGAAHHGERNWEKGQSAKRTWASLIRHVYNFRDGDRTEDHLAAIVFNAMSIMHVEEEVMAGKLPAELLDIEFYNDLPEFHTRPIWNLLEQQVLAYMTDAQAQSDYREWFGYYELKANSLPQLTEISFNEIIANLFNKGAIIGNVVSGQVHSDYALATPSLEDAPPYDKYDFYDYDEMDAQDEWDKYDAVDKL